MDTMKDTKMPPAKDAVSNELRMPAEAEESHMKPLVIYRANCTDGFGAALAAWLKLGDDAVYLPMAYGATYNFDLSGVVIDHVGHEISGREVFILGFSFPREVMDDIFTHAKRVVWLEHHKDAFEMWLEATPTHGQYVLGGPNTIWLDNNKSCALLAWEYFHPGKEIPRLIQHIDAAANRAAITEILDRLEAAEKAVTEAYQRGYATGQEEIEKELAELRSSMKFRTSLIGRTEAKRDALRAEIEELHVLIAAVKKRAAAEFCLRVKKEEEYTRLRAKIEALEQQKPIAWMSSRNGFICKENKNPDYNVPLKRLDLDAQTQGEGK